VFGYFESLLSQDLVKVASEKTRLQNFNDTLVAVGYDFTMVELFVDETMVLFDAMHQAIEAGNRSDRLLLDTFNDENRSNSIVFHFKVSTSSIQQQYPTISDQHQLLTSATMKLNPDQYQPYMEQPVFEFCQSNVDAYGQEIEQISLQALTDGVIAPAHINVIVMYLDRSEGGEVTPHRFVANAGSEWPAITLLYRP
jgi:ubiquitin thioesterase protein OTUB1